MQGRIFKLTKEAILGFTIRLEGLADINGIVTSRGISYTNPLTTKGFFRTNDNRFQGSVSAGDACLFKNAGDIIALTEFTDRQICGGSLYMSYITIFLLKMDGSCFFILYTERNIDLYLRDLYEDVSETIFFIEVLMKLFKKKKI